MTAVVSSWQPSSSSHELDRAAAGAERRASAATGSAWALNVLASRYEGDHEGPDITLAARALGELATVCLDLGRTYGALGDALRLAARGIAAVEDRAHSLVRASAAGTSGVGLTESELAVFTEQFADLQAQEVWVVRSLAAELEHIVVGPPAELDRAGLGEAATRLGQEVTELVARGPQLGLALEGLAVGPGAGTGGGGGGATGGWLDALAEADRLDEFAELLGAGFEAPLALGMAGHGDPVALRALVSEITWSGEEAGVVLDRVVDAMHAGLHPTEAGLPAALFPSAYLDAVVPELGPVGEPGRRGAEGDAIGLPEVGVFHGVLAVHAITGHSTWAGRRLGDHLQGDAWRVWWPDPRPYEDLAIIGSGLAASPALAAAFFNHLGARGTARLASLVAVDAPDEVKRKPKVKRTLTGYQQVVDALGVAATSGSLSFGGGDLIRESDRGSDRAAHLVLASTTIPDGFLMEAAVAAIDLERPHRSGWGAEELTLTVAQRDLRAALGVLQATRSPSGAINVGNSAEWTDLLVALTHPAATGNEAVSTEAARWLVGVAGSDDVPLNWRAAPALDRILASRPTMLVQGEAAAFHLEAAGVDPGFTTTYLDLGRETTYRAVGKVFDAEAGRHLLALQDTLVPSLTVAALAQSRIPPDPGAGSAHGQIEATLTAAQHWSGRAEAASIDARNAFYLSLIDSTAGAVGSQAWGALDVALHGADSFVIDQGVGAGIDQLALLPTDNELAFLHDAHHAEAANTMGSNHQVIAVLADHGVLGLLDEGQLANGIVETEPITRAELGALLDDYQQRPAEWDLLVVLDEHGEPLRQPGVTEQAAPTPATIGRALVTATDWQASLAGFRDTRSSELANFGLN